MLSTKKTVWIYWYECLEWPGEYLTRKAFVFRDATHPMNPKPCKVYFKVRWIPKSLFQKLTGFSSLSEKEKLAEIRAGKDMIQTGILKVMVVRARDLRADDGDSSDPYWVVEYTNHDKQKLSQKTEYRGSTLNPQWNLAMKFNISFVKEAPVPPLLASIFDWDRIPGGDDFLGDCTIDITAAIEKPCNWSVDDYFPIADPKDKRKEAKPALYLQAYFVPEGEKDPNIKPKDKEELFIQREDETVHGTLKIKIVHARDIIKADSNASDPYAIVLFPNEKEHKTSTISSTLNPIFNETF